MSEDNKQEDILRDRLTRMKTFVESEMSTVEPSDEQQREHKDVSFLSAIFNTEHLLIILIVLFLLVAGMSCSFLYNRLIKLIRDHRIIQKHLKRKRKRRMSSQILANSTSRLDYLPSRECLITISLLQIQPSDDVEMRDSQSQTRESIFISSGSNTVEPITPGFTTFGYGSSEEDTVLAPNSRTIKTLDSQHNGPSDQEESTKTRPDDESNAGGFQEEQVHRLESQPSILHLYRNFMKKRSIQSYII